MIIENQPSSASPSSFVEEIDFNELEFCEVLGKGAFGVVSRAVWHGKNVAVKRIESNAEKQAFRQELKQLSRVCHPNIVQLYGACREHPVCLVMEYAEGGSLYNVLHGVGQQPNYTTGNALSWCLQCARGVEYLHNMKPKALVHRDLKPPNLLLITNGTVLKICDFGTACDVQTHMTNNKGSAAWMAPEVFESVSYSEKCDVFSWGIILWEVLTRRKPFDSVGGSAFRIMWAVHSGQRPPLIQNLPKPLELLMTQCWSGKAAERPSMTEVVRIMTDMYQVFKDGDQPLILRRMDEVEDDDEDSYEDYDEAIHFSASPPTVATSGSRVSTFSDTLRYREPKAFPQQVPVVVEEAKHPPTQMSAPPSLAASRESLNDPRISRSATPVDMSKRFSADLTKLDELDLHGHSSPSPSHKGHVMGHRRIGSDEYRRVPMSMTSPLSINVTGAAARDSAASSPKPPIVHHSNTCPTKLTHLTDNSYRTAAEGHSTSPPSRSISYQPPKREPVPVSPRSVSLNPYAQSLVKQGHDHAATNLKSVYQNADYPFLELNLQPIQACPTSPESIQIFQEHCRLLTEFERMQAEIHVLQQRKKELCDQEQQRSLNHGNHMANLEEYVKLKADNDSLTSVHKDLKAQRDKFRKPTGRRGMSNAVAVGRAKP